MARGYRSWEERRQIIRAVIAEGAPPPLASVALTDDEETYFRSRAARAVERTARSTATFKSYYALPTRKPFGYILGIVCLMVAGAVSAAIYLWLHNTADEKTQYPLFAACAATVVASIGWAVAGWISHRNTVRQHTNGVLFARFSQAPFGEALHRFHGHFGYGAHPQVTKAEMDRLRGGKEEERKVAAAVSFLLNYYELVSASVIRGDMDRSIVEDSSRGLIVYYHDKCAPHIRAVNRAGGRTYQNLIKMRTHYREP